MICQKGPEGRNSELNCVPWVLIAEFDLKDQIYFQDVKQYLTLSPHFSTLCIKDDSIWMLLLLVWSLFRVMCGCVCVKDLSWHPDEKPAPQEMTGNSKRVRKRGGAG